MIKNRFRVICLCSDFIIKSRIFLFSANLMCNSNHQTMSVDSMFPIRYSIIVDEDSDGPTRNPYTTNSESMKSIFSQEILGRLKTSVVEFTWKVSAILFARKGPRPWGCYQENSPSWKKKKLVEKNSFFLVISFRPPDEVSRSNRIK